VFTIDFETRSHADIKKVGAARYAEEADIICLAYGDRVENVKLWHPGEPLPQDLISHVEAFGDVEAHNAFFEICIWNMVLAPKYGFPVLNPWQVLCSMGVAAYNGLPESLDALTSYLKVKHLKDKAGEALLKKYCFPGFKLIEDYPEDLERMGNYCVHDVKAAIAASGKMLKLPPQEVERMRASHVLNWTGVSVDLEAVRLGKQEADGLKEHFLNKYLDKGFKLSQNAKCLEHLRNTWGVRLANGKKETRNFAAANQNIPEEAREFLEDWIYATKSSLSKLDALLDRTSSDGKLRGAFRYARAATRRYGGRGVQPQNIPGGQKEKNVIEFQEQWRTGFPGQNPRQRVATLVKGMRGVFKVPDGKAGMAADFNAVEARCNAFLSQELDLLSAFAEGRDPYCEQASKLYRRPVIKDIHDLERKFGKVVILGCGYGMGGPKLLLTSWKDNGRLFTEEAARALCADEYEVYLQKAREYVEKDHKKYLKEKELEEYNREAARRKRLKLPPQEEPAPVIEPDEELDIDGLIEDELPDPSTTRLSFRASCDDLGIDLVRDLPELAVMYYGVDKYREINQAIVKAWAQLEMAMKTAISTPDQTVYALAGMVRFRYDKKGDRLFLISPQGDWMVYHKPRLLWKTGAKKKDLTSSRIIYFRPGIDKGKKKWAGLYGGKIMENVCQFYCRNQTESAMVRLMKAGYTIEMIIHDELRGYAEEAGLEEFSDLMITPQRGFEGFPLKAEAQEVKVYGK
jgi:DNA polymerase